LDVVKMTGTPLGRRWPHALAGLFVAYTFALIWGLFSSQSLLRDSTDRRLIADSDRRAVAISDFVLERRQDAQFIAESREINNYLINQALGMSEEYGLNISLDAIDRRIREHMAQKTLRGHPVFTGISFHDSTGNIFASVGHLPTYEDWSSLMAAAPGLQINPTTFTYQVFAPVIFQGERRGMVVAVGDLRSLSTLLVIESDVPKGAIRYLELIVSPDGELVASPDEMIRVQSGFGRRLATMPEGTIRTASELSDGAALAKDMLALRSSIGSLPLSLVTLVAEVDFHSKATSRRFLSAIAVFPLVLLLGIWAFQRLQRRAELLRSKMDDAHRQQNYLQNVNEALSAEVSRREQAEVELNVQTESLARANSELEQLATVFTHANEGITITSPDGTILEVNEAFCRITGYAPEDVIGRSTRILKSGRQSADFYAEMWDALSVDGHWSGEIWNRRKDGSIYAETLTISAVRDLDGATRHFVALFSDITAQKKHQQQLEHIAHYDTLTGLPNRALLADRLKQAMAQSVRRGVSLAIAYVDLDGFKAINDEYGHDAGDRLLIATAENMNKVLREGDTLARIGGDEFVAVLLDLPDITACRPTLTRLLDAAAERVLDQGNVLQVSASLGVTFFPQLELIDADQLLRQADQAMYQAKLTGKNRFQFFDTAQDRAMRGHHESLERIRQALNDGEFVLYYQPKVNMRSGAIVGLEALIRWEHPEKGLVLPASFLPLIEDHPLAVSIGDFVLDTTLAQIASWRKTGLNSPVSVNIGPRQLLQAGFVSGLRRRLAAYPDIPANQLELEVLETSALEDVDQVSKIIEDCQAFGVTFALDDFGTGYSSLTYLRRLPARTLKIDQSFVRNMLDNADDMAILKGVLGLAAAFRRHTVAEGVETVAHGDMLLDLGCEVAQGYAIARPMPADQVPAWLNDWQAATSWRNRPAR